MLTSAALISLLPANTQHVFIAYSGGVDSHVLLHLASASKIKSKITAVYVHHGLQDEADLWAKHCEQVSLALGVKFVGLNVNAKKSNRQSPEEAARDARYLALKKLISKNDVLLLGQHREDQLETVLLQLFRGAGVQGLSGMPLSMPFGSGVLCRPLLDIPKDMIKAYAAQHGLEWVEDPSNQEDDFDRNYLRNTILPLLVQRWPAIDKTVARSARHCAEANRLIQDMANELLSDLYDTGDRTLDINRLSKLAVSKQHLVIRQWFNRLQLRMPSEKTLHIILKDLVLNKTAVNAEVQVGVSRIKRYRNKLFCLQTVDPIDVAERQWPTEQGQIRLHADQQLELAESDAGILKKLWHQSNITIRFRTGAEKIRLPHREGHHSLKKLYQEKGIPPWERSSIPLIYINDQLAVVVGLWISADFLSTEKSSCYQIRQVKK